MVDMGRWVDEREKVPAALAANRERRTQAETELRAIRDELCDLLVRGQAVALDVAAMARASGVSRDTAHRLLREAGSLSFREKHRLAEQAGVPPGEARAKWFKEQGFGEREEN